MWTSRGTDNERSTHLNIQWILLFFFFLLSLFANSLSSSSSSSKSFYSPRVICSHVQLNKYRIRDTHTHRKKDHEDQPDHIDPLFLFSSPAIVGYFASVESKLAASNKETGEREAVGTKLCCAMSQTLSWQQAVGEVAVC